MYLNGKVNDLKEVKLLIGAEKLFYLTAVVDLLNLESSLVLNVPGFYKTKSFSLAQSSEFIISILCREIPYIISDLLCIVKSPVFYKGFLVMKINNQLALLKPTARSLETDLRCLSIYVSRHKRHFVERLFWLKTRSLLTKNKKRIIEWCPAKEAYRSYLKTLIDFKLCHCFVNYESEKFKKKCFIFEKLAKQRELRNDTLNIKFEVPKFDDNE